MNNLELIMEAIKLENNLDLLRDEFNNTYATIKALIEKSLEESRFFETAESELEELLEELLEEFK